MQLCGSLVRLRDIMRRLALIVAAVLVTIIVRECVITIEEAKYEQCCPVKEVDTHGLTPVALWARIQGSVGVALCPPFPGILRTS
jgi:hypothetical protein